MSFKPSPLRVALSFLFCLQLCGVAYAIAPTSAGPTATVLEVAPTGSVAAGTVVTLTAAVTSGANPVNRGEVFFCDAASPYCEDKFVLGRSQVSKAGVAFLHRRFGVGTHYIKAVFRGTPNSLVPQAASTSSTESLTVTGQPDTRTSLSLSGPPGGYIFKGVVDAYGRDDPSGKLVLSDTANRDLQITSLSLDDLPAAHYFVASVLPGKYFLQNIFAVDLNNDGIPDLVARPLGADASPVLLGVGKGSFIAPPASASPLPPGAISSGDFNCDGILDLAFTQLGSGGNAATITIALGNGDGTYRVGLPNVVTSSYDDVVGVPVVADFNGDGIPDIGFLYDHSGYTRGDGGTGSVTGETINILPGKGDGTFGNEITGATVSGFATVMIVADFNGDGIPDLVTDDSHVPAAVYLGVGDGTFTYQPVEGDKLGTGGEIAVADFNGDGKADVLTRISTLLGKGDGTFREISNPSLFEDSYGGGPLLLGDFNNDGIEDVITINTPDIFFGNGDGTFQGGTHQFFLYQVNDPWVGVAADFNGDGLTDVILNFTYHETLMEGLNGFTKIVQSGGISIPGAGPHNIVATYSGDQNYSPSQSATVSFTNGTATPILDPAPGHYKFTQYVSLSDATPGATIYYTLNGTVPVPGLSTVYKGPIRVDWQWNIRALALSSTLGESSVAGGMYTINRPSLPPAFSSPSGTYTTPFTFTLTGDSDRCKAGGCKLYYRIDDGGFVAYTAPVTLTKPGSHILRAVTTEAHYADSVASTVTYVLR